jgi:ribonucleoside-diphosphate reductase alpha chain
MQLTKNGLKILERYMKKDENGNFIETPEDIFLRVAKNISKEEKKYNPDSLKWENDFFEVMNKLEFLPNIPTFSNAGKEVQQLAACFVLPVEDSVEQIFESLKQMVIIQKTGGGTGFSFSKLRPKGSKVKETGGVASGPVSFMKVFDCTTGAIKEGGIRRGANMGVLRIDHPDIIEFINCKRIEGKEFSNFNISVALTDEFMNNVIKNKDFILKYMNNSYNQIKARKLFDLIAKNAWTNGEPGVIFIDTINNANKLSSLGKIEATNPCGEQPLFPYESCILGSINLEKCIFEGRINYPKLEYLIKLGVRFLDDCIDASSYPLKQTEEIVKKNRKIGLGVMGFSNMLIKLGISYNSALAIKIADELMKFFSKKAIIASNKLAKERGVFPNFNKSDWKMKVRNSTITTIAPTGTISIIANTTPGIEPLFSIMHEKNTGFGKMMDINNLFLEVIDNFENKNKDLSDISKYASLKDSILPEKLKKLFVSSYEIPPKIHVKMQATFQKYVDNAISKTVNLPFDSKIEDVKKIYLDAWKSGCKGLTVYRNNSRKIQAINFCKDKCNIYQ